MAVDLNQLEITVAQLEQDATVIGKIVNDPADEPNTGQEDGTVTTRLGDVVKNVNRVLDEVAAKEPVANLSNSTTTDLAEGTNLYYTNERVDTLLTAGTNIALTYDNVAGTLTIDAAGGGGGGSSFQELEINDNSFPTLTGTSAGRFVVFQAQPIDGDPTISILNDGWTAGDEVTLYPDGIFDPVRVTGVGGMIISARNMLDTITPGGVAKLKFITPTFAVLYGDLGGEAPEPLPL